MNKLTTQVCMCDVRAVELVCYCNCDVMSLTSRINFHLFLHCLGVVSLCLRAWLRLSTPEAFEVGGDGEKDRAMEYADIIN